MPHFNLGDIEESRRLDREFCALAPEVDSTGVVITASGACRSVAARCWCASTVHDPSEGNLPAIYDLHAGGCCVGSIESTHSRNVELAQQVQRRSDLR